MKLNKELVFDFMKSLDVCKPNKEGITTKQLAEKLNMQRSNLSTILNRLVEEKLIEKQEGRPVYYRLNGLYEKRKSFEAMIGYDGSLRNAIQTAKAALLYPQRNLHTLILGENGSGKSFFVRSMYQFAQEMTILDEKAPLICLNCRYYVDNHKELKELLLNIQKEDCLLNRAKKGILYIDHLELFPSSLRSDLIDLIENATLLKRNGFTSQSMPMLICSYDESYGIDQKELYMQKFPMVVSLPSLSSRPLSERYELIEKFFYDEMLAIQKPIQINTDLLRCLLLYECKNNLKQLGNDIKSGCAKAYIRNSEKASYLYPVISDFPNEVRKGILFYKENRYQIDQLVHDEYDYRIIESGLNKEKKDLKRNNDNSIYDVIDQKANELKEKGASSFEINSVMNDVIESEIKNYSRNLKEQIVNTQQLSKICDQRIIQDVSQFMMKLKNENLVYSVSVFYGLCLHLNAILERGSTKQKFSTQQAREIMEKHPQEYRFALLFCADFEKKYGINIPIDEVIFVAMFLYEEKNDDPLEDHPVILIAMHGENAAESISRTINTLSTANNVYGFDMQLDESVNDAYEHFKKKIISIHQNAGVLMIYDMGSFKTMAQMVSLETNIEILTMQLPLTLIGIDCARKALYENNIHEIYENIHYSWLSNQQTEASFYSRAEKEKVIITLCMSGEGGANQVRDYLLKKCEIVDEQILPLAISNRKQLLQRIVEINSSQEILCIIGSYDPEIYGIRFIELSEIFSCDPGDVKDILLNQHGKIEEVDFNSIFDYLNTQLKYVDPKKLKQPLIDCITQISDIYGLSKSMSIGLLMHIASMINNLVNFADMPVYQDCDEILSMYKKDENKIHHILEKLENKFDIYFDKNEIAGIIRIIYKL